MKKLIVYALLSAICQPAFPQNQQIKAIQKYCDARHTARDFNGNILLARGGKIIFRKSYGFSDLEKKTPLTAGSVFNICSITKEFTATAIMLLKEQGKLALDDSLRKFFPGLPYSHITLRHMLTHTSGMVSTEFLFKEWNTEKEITPADMLQLLEDKQPPLLFQPGERFEYSNIPYVLLAMIIEKISGSSYAAFLKQHIFDKLGMMQTRVKEPGIPVPHATGNYIYDYVNDSAAIKTYFTPARRPDWKKAFFVSSLYGNGNIYSTAIDLLKWKQAMNSNTIISEESQREMITSAVDAGGFTGIEKYGYGISISHPYGDTMFFHNGGTLGYSTTLRHLKNKDITIITLSNTSRNNDPVEAITALLYDQPVEMPLANKEVKLTPAELALFTGTYRLGERKFTIELKHDTLFRIVPNTAPLRLVPKSRNLLYYTDGSDRDLLVRKEAGKWVIKLIKADGLAVDLEKQD